MKEGTAKITTKFQKTTDRARAVIKLYPEIAVGGKKAKSP